MSVLNRDDFIKAVASRIGEDTSDDALAFMENMTDTFNDMEQRAKGDGTDWKAKYEENDKTWREKYKQRFYSSEQNNDNMDADTESDSEASAPKTFEDLFTKAQ